MDNELAMNPYDPPGPNGVSDQTLNPRTNTVIVDPEIMVRAHLVHHGRLGGIIRLSGTVIGSLFVVSGLCLFALGQVVLGIMIGVWGAFVFERIGRRAEVLRRKIQKQYKQMGKECEVVTYEPTTDFLRIATEKSESRLAWTEFRKWREADSLILAYHHNALFNVIPITQLDDETQRQILQSLLANSVQV